MQSNIYRSNWTGRDMESAHQQLLNIIDSLPDATFAIDRDKKVIAWNRALEQMTGTRKEDIIGQGDYAYAIPLYGERRPIVIDFLSEESSDFKSKYQYVEKRGNTLFAEVFAPLVCGGHGATLWISASPLLDSEGNVAGAIESIRDITEQKRAGEEIRNLNAELEERVTERTEQLEVTNLELESFYYSVSHDLRAPLRSIDGFSQVLLEDYEGQIDENGQDALHRVRNASQRMESLINDLLALSRISRSELKRTTVDLTAIAQSIAARLQAGEPLRKATFIISPRLTAQADAHLIQIAFENLLGNAWKFTSKHATARIEFGVTPDEARRVYFIRDDGAGFDISSAKRLFGAFQRMHSSVDFEGSGIGLATVQRILHRHGGRIWAESSVEKGATFYFTLGNRN